MLDRFRINATQVVNITNIIITVDTNTIINTTTATIIVNPNTLDRFRIKVRCNIQLSLPLYNR